MLQHILIHNNFNALAALLEGTATPEQKQQLAQYVEAQRAYGNSPDDPTYVKTAKKLYQHLAGDGDIDFDDAPLVSPNEEGAFVMAWLYVRKDELPNPALRALRDIAKKHPRMSVGRLVAAVTAKQPTPYAWLGVVSDDDLATEIAAQVDVAQASDHTPAVAVLDMLEAKLQLSTVGELLQVLVDATTRKAPASLPDSNKGLLNSL
jgi:hypothetical protein